MKLTETETRRLSHWSLIQVRNRDKTKQNASHALNTETFETVNAANTETETETQFTLTGTLTETETDTETETETPVTLTSTETETETPVTTQI